MCVRVLIALFVCAVVESLRRSCLKRWNVISQSVGMNEIPNKKKSRNAGTCHNISDDLSLSLSYSSLSYNFIEINPPQSQFRDKIVFRPHWVQIVVPIIRVVP